jgi:hypothetical protein
MTSESLVCWAGATFPTASAEPPVGPVVACAELEVEEAENASEDNAYLQ